VSAADTRRLLVWFKLLRMRCFVFAFLLVFVSSSAFAADNKPKGANLVKLPPATAQIANLEINKPKQPCYNWSWASAMETLLAREKVEVSQTELILKSDLGELCIDTPVDLGKIKKVLDGRYVLADGSKVMVEVVVTPGSPTDVGYLVKQTKLGRPLLITWKGRPLVLQAVEYDEYIYPNAQRMFEARKLTFADPLSSTPVVFEKLVDDTSDLGGTLELVVTRIP
jgi:hypothetical protein